MRMWTGMIVDLRAISNQYEEIKFHTFQGHHNTDP
jgi:hypothetical protein